METSFLVNLNDDLLKGRPTTPSKLPDLLPKIAGSLHILEHCYAVAIKKSNFNVIPEEINVDTLRRALIYLEVLEDQKQMFHNVSNINIRLRGMGYGLRVAIKV